MQDIRILPLREQAKTVDGWLADRLQHLLPDLMRQAGVDMWILVGDEYHLSPLLRTFVPAHMQMFNNGRLILVFHSQPSGATCLALSRFDYAPIYQNAWDMKQEEQWVCLRRLVDARQPKRIAINSSKETAFAGDLTVGLEQQLLAALGTSYLERLTASDQLAVNWLQLRSEAELATYPAVVQVAKALISEIFSSRTVRAGETTGRDLIWTFRQRTADIGLTCWFHPFINVWREGVKQSADMPISAGDLLHVDFGIEYLGLCTDHQQLAYVLREGETDAPAGLKRLMASGHRMQEIMLQETRLGRTGNQVLAAIVGRAGEEGINMEISSHPIGYHGHAAGPAIGYWGRQSGIPGLGDGQVLKDSCFALELAVTDTIPEWQNSVLRLGMEEDMVVGATGAAIIGERQQRFLLIGAEK